MTAWPPVISQIGYPGAGDIDDCWAVATIWAAHASSPAAPLPTVTKFREKARRPDKPGPTGGNNHGCYLGAIGCFPGIHPVIEWQTTIAAWSTLMASVRAGRPISLAVLSSALPIEHRYGFGGAHRVGLVASGSRLLLMNPLAKKGAPLKPISEADIRRAASGLGTLWAVLFPEPARPGIVHVKASTQWTYRIVQGRAVHDKEITTGGFSAQAHPFTATQADGTGLFHGLRVLNLAYKDTLLNRDAYGVTYTE